jgi:hypothetical protein
MPKYTFMVKHNGISKVFAVDKVARFSTVAFEEAVEFGLPSGFDEWKVTDSSDEPGTVVYTKKDGSDIAFGHLYSQGLQVDDFDEEDKPSKRAAFTVFGNGKAVQCNSTRHLAQVVADLIGINARHYVLPVVD